MKRILAALALCALALTVPTAALAGDGNGKAAKGDVIDVGRDLDRHLVDFGVVGDLHTVLPAVTEEVTQRKG